MQEDVHSLIISTVVLSATGSLSPGPLTFAALLVGPRRGKLSGVLLALGHTIFEIPYVILLVNVVSAVKSYLDLVQIRLCLAIIISTIILYFSYIAFKDGLRIAREGGVKYEGVGRIESPVLLGVVLTGLNPHFLTWWITIGLPLIVQALELGHQGLLIMCAAHVWQDYLWLGALAYLSHEGRVVLGRRYGYALQALAVALASSGLLIVVRTLL